MNLKFNKKNYKSNLVEFSEKYICNNYFFSFYNIKVLINFCLYKNVSFYYSEKY